MPRRLDHLVVCVRDLAQDLDLAADAGQYRLVPWVLAQRYEGLDLTATEQTLAAAGATGQANVFQVIALVMLQLEKSKTADALSTLDQTQQQFLPLNKNAWHHWRATAARVGTRGAPAPR